MSLALATWTAIIIAYVLGDLLGNASALPGSF